MPITPPSHASALPWAKSPARVPDPEHLKAVWSQAPSKERISTHNSLKGISDELPAVPFNFQDVKSDDGGTSPPGSTPGPVAPPSRMSASEVTRAFQTVPPGPSNPLTPSSSRSNPFSSTTSSPLGGPKVLKPAPGPIGYLPPQFNPNARPHYLGYPSPMTSHSPSPTLMYSHVMPNGMTHPPAPSPYGQPMWMHVGTMSPQTPQMGRPPPPTQYSPSLMPYHPVPGGQNGMYQPPPGHHNPQGSPASYGSPTGSHMLVSPVLPHATPVQAHMPMYAASPVMLTVPPPGSAPQPQPYPGAVGMGRGGMPVRNPMDSRQRPPTGPPGAPGVRFPPHNPGYTHVSPQSFIRPSW